MRVVGLIEWFQRLTGVRRRAFRAGEWGEWQAEQYLLAKGLRVLGRRVRVGRRDEVDLVARQGDTLVFVEVKTRKSEQFGRPMDSVDRHKRHTLSRAAVRYVRQLKRPNSVVFRFDVVEVIGEEGGNPAVRHIENAFPLDRQYMVP